MNEIEKAHIEINKIDGGIDFTELKDNRIHHNKLFFDKFGIPYKFSKGILYYSDKGYGYKRRTWNEANMDGFDLPYKKFFTPSEFEIIKPSYL